MSRESTLQTNIKRELKSLGCEVLVIRPQPGIPDGWEDIMFLKEGFWGCLETKKDPKAPYQPLQKERIKKHNEWSWSKRVDPTTWPEIRTELRSMLK
jgi:hypothetical protein